MQKDQLQQLQQSHHNKQIREFYKTVHNVEGFKRNTTMIRNAESEIISGKQEVLNRWKEYFTELLNEDTEENTQECEEIHKAFQLISTPSEEEVLRAIDKLRNNKAPGPDMIPAELLKVHEEERIKRLHKITEAAWVTERLPHTWKTSIICPIHKKGNILNCANYCGITQLIKYSSTYYIKDVKHMQKN
jgi:hypothetical protein